VLNFSTRRTLYGGASVISPAFSKYRRGKEHFENGDKYLFISSTLMIAFFKLHQQTITIDYNFTMQHTSCWCIYLIVSIMLHHCNIFTHIVVFIYRQRFSSTLYLGKLTRWLHCSGNAITRSALTSLHLPTASFNSCKSYCGSCIHNHTKVSSFIVYEMRWY